jgi:hypothetical protein
VQLNPFWCPALDGCELSDSIPGSFKPGERVHLLVGLRVITGAVQSGRSISPTGNRNLNAYLEGCRYIGSFICLSREGSAGGCQCHKHFYFGTEESYWELFDIVVYNNMMVPPKISQLHFFTFFLTSYRIPY